MQQKSTKETYITDSAEETFKIGKKMALSLQKGDIILLSGDLGSGKTCFVQGLAEGLHIIETINSPTYVYIHSYPLKDTVFYHIDLYRIEENKKLQFIGMEDILFDKKNIIAIEWPEILKKSYSLLHRKVIEVSIEREKKGERRKLVIKNKK